MTLLRQLRSLHRLIASIASNRLVDWLDFSILAEIASIGSLSWVLNVLIPHTAANSSERRAYNSNSISHCNVWVLTKIWSGKIELLSLTRQFIG